MRRALDDGDKVGQIKRIASQFSFLARRRSSSTSNIRATSDLEPLGLPGRPRLVQHPVHALGDELSDADAM